MTLPAPSLSPDPIVELELIRWRQARFERITECVEDALPALMTKIESTVASMSSIAVGTAQISPDNLWKTLFEPWARQVATRVEAEMDEEIGVLAASLSEKGTSQDVLRVALPALAGVGVLAASLAAIPSVMSIATVTTTSFFFFTTTTISWPVLAVGGAGIAVASFTGSRLVDWLSDQNRAHLEARLQCRARIAALGHGLASGERSLVTDLQAATLRSLEAKLEIA
ncbi:hypothetical protein CLV79_11917 [Limimaricola soesokkakensis]|uniref:Uncharacterized protein n=1 Tax=Limimaricola soesokkakensis TaxID=1343159 RepID=A0A1X7A472_9RHOB|nr:hypothetical protein [Limimaricola soesokkakensis]PSK80830.1 hypothetical protein CLV79_11917 [Limimaricola soesokkakensis]SLN69728.1 hypothetical protein LOS8367_03505 [Limimaricola soesokkakensis]